MITFRKALQNLAPVQILLIGFVVITLLAAILLSLPLSTATGEYQPFIDALFISASVVTTTGLVVVDIGRFYSLFGQLVILALIQICGLGYVGFFVFIINIFGRRLSLRGDQLVEESMVVPSRGEIARFLKKILLYTFIFEAGGALILSLYWMNEFPVGYAIYVGIFHSISAFCTAGFSLFTEGLAPYHDSVVVNLTINSLAIAGGISFLVLSEIPLWLVKVVRRVWPRGLSLHSQLALLYSILLFVVGTAVIFLGELHAISDRTLTTVPSSLSLSHLLVTSTFQAISASTTTGFNTVDVGAMSETSLFTLIILMFIGAPAGGTGGGIKATTFAILLLVLRALLTGNEDVEAFRKHIAPEIIYKAIGVTLMAMALTVPATIALTLIEPIPMLNLLFEVVSAFATAGLSTGITAEMSSGGKAVIILVMLIGRVGPLGVGYSLIRNPRPLLYNYPPEEVFVG